MSEVVSDSEPRVSRSSFLRQLTVGAVSGFCLERSSIVVYAATEKLTDGSVGNASESNAVDEQCANAEDQLQCEKDFMLSPHEVFGAVVEGPLIEEGLFRALPSTMVSSRGEGAKLSRQEVVVGAISSLIFGGLHNFTSKGFDKHNIPSPQITSGFGLWYLQRKFGFLSNLTAHSTINATALYSLSRWGSAKSLKK